MKPSMFNSKFFDRLIADKFALSLQIQRTVLVNIGYSQHFSFLFVYIFVFYNFESDLNYFLIIILILTAFFYACKFQSLKMTQGVL